MKAVMIVAADLDDVIGQSGQLPWYLPPDLKRFRELTSARGGHILIMGRTTYDSILGFRKGKPLGDGRVSLVVTSRELEETNAQKPVPDPVTALMTAMQLATDRDQDQFFICGGAQIYQALLPWTDEVKLTRVQLRSGGDVRLPDGWLDDFAPDQTSQHYPASSEMPGYSFEVYTRFK